MNQEQECVIVRDLLPNYIEKMTGDETNRFIEEHMASCEQCRSMLRDMTAEISRTKTIPEKELKFLKKIRNTRLVAAALCIILAIVAAYLYYASEYEYSGDKSVLSAAITEYTSHGNHPVDAYVLETKEVNGTLIAFFKDNSNSDVYGFALLLKGINQQYRLVSAHRNPTDYSAVVEPFRFTAGRETFYAVGGYNIGGSIAHYGLNFVDASYNPSSNPQGKKELLTFDVKNIQFLDVYSQQDIDNMLRERNADWQELFLSPFGSVLLDSTGADITDNYRFRVSRSTWGAGTGTAEQFLMYVFIAIILIMGFVLARYIYK